MDACDPVKIIVGPITPFKSDGKLDLAALDEEVTYVIHQGASEVIAAGFLIQDYPLLSTRERKELMEKTASAVGNKASLVAGVNGRTILETGKLIEFVTALGASRVISGIPYGRRPSLQEIYSYFDFLNEQAPAPIFFYHHPALGLELPAEGVNRLMQLSNVGCLKETRHDFKIIELSQSITKKWNKELYTTSEVMLPSLLFGIRGISVPPILVGLAKRLSSAYSRGDLDLARDIQGNILEFQRLPIKKASSSIYRAGFRIIGIDIGHERAPYEDLEPQEEKVLKDFLKKAGIA
ncbi:MAG: dihydrodipicolinate synthase family protein [Deltaproteobacteria bacterium]|nr:dihydrodipicolinate synthase family protein [Deltaproteobacteria bacterium]